MWRRNPDAIAKEVPRLATGTARQWKRFVLSSRRPRWFKPDWPLFYAFVRHCHDHRAKVSAADIFHLAENEGLALRDANLLATFYQHCRAVLGTRYRVPFDPNRSLLFSATVTYRDRNRQVHEERFSFRAADRECACEIARDHVREELRLRKFQLRVARG